MWSVNAADGMRVFGGGQETDYGQFDHDGTDFNISHVNTTDVNWTGATNYKFDNSIFITEKASANSDVATLGQFWVRTATPNEPMFTDDAGGDQLIDPAVSEINTQNGNYTLVLGDKGKTIHKVSGGAGETITIPANGSVAFPLGTLVGIQNDGGGDLSIAITTDTLTGTDGTTGTRTLGDNHTAVIQKVTATTWKYAASDL